MLSFSWKKKAGLSQPRAAAFSAQEELKENSLKRNLDVDWLTATNHSKVFVLEDGKSKANRLRQEGVLLAEAEKWWAAIGRWNAAVSLTPEDHVVHEMLAQAYMQICEVYPALTAAETAVKLAPSWWIGHQTLGRAQLGLGEVKLAVKSFSRAAHLQPDQTELWQSDLFWAQSLLKKCEELKKKESQSEALSSETSSKVIEFENPSKCVQPDVSSRLDDVENNDENAVVTMQPDEDVHSGNASLPNNEAVNLKENINLSTMVKMRVS